MTIDMLLRRSVDMATHAAGRLCPWSRGFRRVRPRTLSGATSGFLVPNPPFHLLETKIRGSVHDAKSGTGARSDGGCGEAGYTLTFAYHAILEMTDLQDTVPRSPLPLSELGGFIL